MNLKSERIVLRDWKMKDLELYKFWHLGHHKWMDFNGPYYPNITPEDLEIFLKRVAARIEKNNWSSPRKKIVIADANDNYIGNVSWYWISEETNWMAAGLVINDPKHWSKGFGYEALVLWISYLFSQNEKLVRMDLKTWSGNIGMIKLAEKLGFIEEGRFRKARIVNGEYFDNIGMGILREEWEAHNH